MSTLDDDGSLSGDFLIIEEPDGHGHKQALWTGVRPVWYGDEPSPEPMIQVSYQEDHLESRLLFGPVFFTEDTWEKFKEAVDWRLEEWKRNKSSSSAGTSRCDGEKK